MTKARKIIIGCEQELGRRFGNDEEAYQALLFVDEVIWSAPPKAGRVILKAMRPSESYNKFLSQRI
jgi:hypothetical protein